MFCASSISAASLYVLAAVKTDSALTDHTTGFVPPSSTTVTPAEPPLAAISCCIEIARPPTPRGTTNEVKVEKMLPTWVVPSLAWTSSAPDASSTAIAIAGSSLYETCRRTMLGKAEVHRWDSARTALRKCCERLGSLESLGSPQPETEAAIERDVRDPGQTRREPDRRAQEKTGDHERGRRPVAMHRVVDRHRAGGELPTLETARHAREE